jgi:hypothetical protein
MTAEWGRTELLHIARYYGSKAVYTLLFMVSLSSKALIRVVEKLR